MLLVRHDHVPIYRVVRQSWPDPLDASYSRTRSDNRWNPLDAFGTLYTCCSERVARAVTLDVFRLAGVVPDDLQPSARPQLVEIDWRGEVVDVASAEGIAAAGFPGAYPMGVDYRQTQPKAAEWHAAGIEGVVCRSASLARLGAPSWIGPHQDWSELAIFVDTSSRQPVLLTRRVNLTWLTGGSSPQPP